MKLKLDDEQKDLMLVSTIMFGGFSLMIVAIGVAAWLIGLGESCL